MMAALQYLLVVFMTALLVWDVQAAKMDIFMDSPTACGKTFPAGDREVFMVKPRGSVGVSNPPTSCAVYFESSHASSNYKFEIVVEAAAFRDCGLSLRIFDGKSTGNNYIRMLGCGSTTSIEHFYSKDGAMTLLLSRTQNQYFFGSDYQLRVQLYYDTVGADTVGADEYIVVTTNFPVGAIIGVILGVIVFIAAAILLGWCYKTGRLPGLSPVPQPVGFRPPAVYQSQQYQLCQLTPSVHQPTYGYPGQVQLYPSNQPQYPEDQPQYPQDQLQYPQGQPQYPQGMPNSLKFNPSIPNAQQPGQSQFSPSS